MISIKYIFKTFLCVLALFVFMVSAGAEEPAPGTISMTLGDSAYTFNNNMVSCIETLDNGNKRITIGLSDREQKVELMITIDCSAKAITGEQHLNTTYNNIMIMFKSSKGNFVVIPPVRMAKSESINYIEKNSRKGKRKFRKRKARWHGMRRGERLASGKGIIRHGQMKDKTFSMVLVPVVENGSVTELKGTFSGLVRAGKNNFQRGQYINIKNGKFHVEVAR
ncbi:MAG: hypothetical protein GY754_31090 [bacterium]|nr:hypothetical protein [bacterium]